MMGSPFPPHPVGMQQHPGAPQGHPMSAGMAHNPSQPGAVPGMQHQLGAHMGASGPGQQINPAVVMGGIPPGAGNPNAHAAMHLNPAQAHVFQQQHMFSANPAVQQQMQQQRLAQLQQQQAARQALAAQQYGMPMGMPMGGLTQQQYAAALRSGIPMSMGPHLARAQLAQQQQGQAMNPGLAQQLALQHQQMQLQQAGQGGPHQMTPQHLQQVQLQQALAAQQHQQQQAQQQQHAQQQQQQQQHAQQQAAQQQAHQQQQAQQQHQAQQQQAAQQQAQQPPPQTPGQQTPQMGQQQPPQGPQQPGQGGPGVNGTPQNQGPRGPTPQPNAQQQPQAPAQTPQPNPQQQAQLVAQAQQQGQNAAGVVGLMQQHQQKAGATNLNAMCHLKLMQFQAHLSGFPGSKDQDEDLRYWMDFVKMFFSEKAMFRHAIPIKDDAGMQSEKQYEIYYVTLPRYFHTHTRGGIKRIQMILDNGTTDKALHGDCHYMENTKTSFVYWFDSGSHVIFHGTFRATFNSEQKFELFEFQSTHHEEYLSYDATIQSARPLHNWIKDWKNLNPEGGIHSPEMSNKKNKQKAYKSPAVPPPDFGIPPKTKHGLGDAVHQFLEMVEVMAQMNPLINFVNNHPGVSPYGALEQFVAQINGGGPNINGQSMPQGGPRTPSFSQFPIGASPALANQILPGSPHIGSPAPGQMQAPSMQLQASQQGTSSSGPSANTSPSQNNKRRRSTVKLEDENAPANAPTPVPVGTPQLNGVTAKVKPPTPRMQKRAKINPS